MGNTSASTTGAAVSTPPRPFIRVFPVPKNNRGHAFSNIDDILAHLQGEPTGHWLIFRESLPDTGSLAVTGCGMAG
ncbi:hypothetical protein AU764_004805, partial [Salmonella enterica subsp. diarizonae]|nr:hypothetical protein [Salmonella enterica subsp. diarizonae]EEJ5275823.1 hypothetical protein [Salmonella enterica subsp. diarizonae]